MRYRGSGRLAQALGLESSFFPVYHARRSVWYFASPIALAQHFRPCCRSAERACALLSAFQVMARSQNHALTARGLARKHRKPLPARLRRTAGSVALAVFSSVVSNARGISERTAGLTIRSSRTAAG